jgi:hypothetical protein
VLTHSFCKAKHDKARQGSVERDWNGDAVYVDAVHAPAG